MAGQDFFGDQVNIAGVRVKWSPENKKENTRVEIR